MKDEQLEQIIFEILKNLADELDVRELENPTLDTKLYGVGGNLDSLALVSFISDLEDRMSDEFGFNVILANDKTMSAKHSPFRNVKALKECILGMQ